MGAWGSGLLQNDDALDGLSEAIGTIEADVLRLRRRRGSQPLAGRLSAAVGLLLQFHAWHCFDAESEFHTALLAILDRQQPAFSSLNKAAVDTLLAIRAGQGHDLVHREGPLPADLSQAFYHSKPGEV